MAVSIGGFDNRKLLRAFLLPSWLSGFVAVTVTVVIVGLAVIFTHFGTTVMQSLVGLQHAYAQSSVGVISNELASNTWLNNTLLFIMWGSVGLMAYSVAHGIFSEFSKAREVLREAHYINAEHQHILRNAILRETVKIAALAAWWLLFRYAIFTLIPHMVATAHIFAANPAQPSGWYSCLIESIVCIVIIHVLTVLMRLSLLRVRIFGTDIEE